jgi:putative FmdB family regulatory protein
MPLYEYHCDDCGHEFELIRKFSDPPLEKCPDCGGRLRKLFSSPAIKFKGSGFYVNDYGKKDQAAGAPSGGSQSDTVSKDDGKDAPGEKSEKSDKTGAAKSDKGSSPTGSAAPSSSSPNESTSSTKPGKDSA